MACFSTTHFASQDKHLLPSSLRRSGEGAGKPLRGGRGAAAAAPPERPRQLRTAPRRGGAAAAGQLRLPG